MHGLIILDLPNLQRVLAHLGVKLKANTCFGVVSGAHTYFLAADTPEEVSERVRVQAVPRTACIPVQASSNLIRTCTALPLSGSVLGQGPALNLGPLLPAHPTGDLDH